MSNRLPRSERFSNKPRNDPGPGAHSVTSPRTIPGGALDRSRRPSIADPKNFYPGPGTYTIAPLSPSALPALKDAITQPRRHSVLRSGFINEDCYDPPSFYESQATAFNTTAKSKLSQTSQAYPLRDRHCSKPKSFATHHQRTNTRRLSLDLTQRFGPREINTPGPGHYSPREVSNSTASTMGKSPRITLACDTLSPGPGAYSYSFGSSGKRISLAQRWDNDRQSVGRGPGECDERIVMRKAPRAVFGKTKREGVQILNNNPGPGSYGQTEPITFHAKRRQPVRRKLVAENDYSFDEFC